MLRYTVYIIYRTIITTLPYHKDIWYSRRPLTSTLAVDMVQYHSTITGNTSVEYPRFTSCASDLLMWGLGLLPHHTPALMSLPSDPSVFDILNLFRR